MENQADSIKYKIPKPEEYEFDNIPLDDPRVWAKYHQGDVIGTFQTESDLGKIWCKKIKPSSIEDLSDVISLVRPGPLESLQSDKYANIKNGKEEEFYIHDSLIPILKSTKGCLLYQEQSMKIAKELANFDDGKQNELRKLLGKKKPEMVAKLREEFIQGCLKVGKINKEIAEEIFGWVEKGQRYLFNLSHSTEYAVQSYQSMYAKTHFPTEFYCAWLTFAGEKIDPMEERGRLINDAKFHDITIDPPDIRKKNTDFEIVGDREIIFGLSHIRGVGNAAIKSIHSVEDQLDTFIGFIKSVKKIKRNVAESLIKSGACDCYGLDRSYMLKNIHAIFGRHNDNESDGLAETRTLTPKELKHLLSKIDTLSIKESLQSVIDNEACIKKRIPTIEAKIKYLENVTKDTNRQKSIWEKLYLGINLTCSAADDVAKIDKNVKTCKEVYRMPNKSQVTLHVVIDEVKQRKTSEKARVPNQPYCYLGVSDNSGALNNIVCWPEIYDEYKNDLVEGCVICLYGKKDSWKGREQISANSIQIIG